MHLAQFEVQNFRSLEKNIKVNLGQVTNIVGANNEGKSNLVRAMNTAVQLLRIYARTTNNRSSSFRKKLFQSRAREYFQIERDYPKKYQEKERRRAKTRFRLIFNLTTKEIQEFKSEFGSQINNELAIEIVISPSTTENVFKRSNFTIDIEPIKSGVTKKNLTAQMDKIAHYLSNKFSLVTSQAVRPGASGIQELQDLLESRLRALSHTDEEYKKTIQSLQGHRQRVIDEVSNDFKNTLGNFIPDLSEFNIKVEDAFRSQTSGLQVTIDDGVATDLSEKGDGIQSLFTLALLQHKATLMRKEQQNMLTVIEEPEAHLNSGSMHELKEVLRSISEQQQVVIVTHSAIFVNRDEVGKNIIVQGNQAYNASSIAEIRTALGIQDSESLSSPEASILVEGESDRIFLEEYLKYKYNSTLFKAFRQNRLAIQKTGGTGYLEFHLHGARQTLTKVFLITDNDPAGREAVEKARKKGLIDQTHQASIVHPRIKNGKQPDTVTIEDVYTPEVLTEAFNRIFGTHLDSSSWNKCAPVGALKRMSQLCKEYGKTMIDSDIENFKIMVGDIGRETHNYEPAATAGIDQLIKSIEMKLNLS